MRVDYGGDNGEAWLRELVTDLADDGLLAVDDDGENTVVRLRR